MDRGAAEPQTDSKQRSQRDAARLALAIVDVWTFVLATGISAVGLGVSFMHPPLAPLIGTAVLLHWLLLGRVLERRRWACALSPLLGALYLFPPSAWGWDGLESLGSAALLGVIVACATAGWQELKSGW